MRTFLVKLSDQAIKNIKCCSDKDGGIERIIEDILYWEAFPAEERVEVIEISKASRHD